MSNSRSLFVDLVKSMPSGTEWQLDVSEMHTDFYNAIRGIVYEKNGISMTFILNDGYRKQLIDLTYAELHEVVQRVTIAWQGSKVFEAFDGFEIAIISKYFKISETPLSMHLDKDILFISDDW